MGYLTSAIPIDQDLRLQQT